MAIHAHCRSCGSRLSVDDELAGSVCTCPACGEGVNIPAGRLLSDDAWEQAGGLPEEIGSKPVIDRSRPPVMRRRAPVPPPPPAEPSAAAPASVSIAPLAEAPDAPRIDIGRQDAAAACPESSTPAAPRPRRRSPLPIWLWVALGIGGLAAVGLLAAYALRTGGSGRQLAAEDAKAKKAKASRDSELLELELLEDYRPKRPAEKAGPSKPPTPPAPAEKPKLAKSLEEVQRAIVKFELARVGGEGLTIGTGFVFNDRRWVATNQHVVANATSAMRVVFSNGRRGQLAGIVARDPEHDLAIFQLADSPAQLTMLEIGYADRPALGAEVYAVGHPFNVDFSFSKGIVSAVRTTRELLEQSREHIVGQLHSPPETIWIQHDARIAVGNSGGPLLDKAGRVMGVNTFVHKQAEYGYASHVRYLRDLAGKASGKLTPLPPAPGEAAPPPTEGGPFPQPILAPAEQIERMFRQAAALGWKPERAEHYGVLAELARMMTAVKQAQSNPAAVPQVPREVVAAAARTADAVFLELGKVEFNADRVSAINGFAAEGMKKPGTGVIVAARFVGGGEDSLLFEIDGKGQRFVVPASGEAVRAVGRGRWLVLGIALGSITLRDKQSNPIDSVLVLAHYLQKLP